MDISEENVVAAKIVYTLIWIFLATYSFEWGANEVTVVDPIDESGWVPDGAFAASLTRTSYDDADVTY